MLVYGILNCNMVYFYGIRDNKYSFLYYQQTMKKVEV